MHFEKKGTGTIRRKVRLNSTNFTVFPARIRKNTERKIVRRRKITVANRKRVSAIATVFGGRLTGDIGFVCGVKVGF